MASYFLYRINSAYDGFVPSELRRRTTRNVLRYNWGAYVENVEPGDVVLTYFHGPGCRPGIYAIAVVGGVDVATRTQNVSARMLFFSDQDRKPVVSVRGNEAVFERIRTRPRGAEVVVPEPCARAIYELLAQDHALVAAAARRNVHLPGEIVFPVNRIVDVPLIVPGEDFSAAILGRPFTGAFWIRPRQASWLANYPNWLYYITSAFGGFKSGDLSHLDEFAKAVAAQVQRAQSQDGFEIGVVVGVPLNQAKQDLGETDRVAHLARAVAHELDLPYSPAFRLSGNVSRRLYKQSGRSSSEFRRDYLRNLEFIASPAVKQCVEAGRTVLLVDDVYTDGLTTSVVCETLRAASSSPEVKVHIATLGVMAKLRNMDGDLIERWR